MLAQFVFNVCSDRLDNPVTKDDSEIVYPSKRKNGIEAQITFCEKISSKTGKPIEPGTEFIVKEKSKINALVNLQNRDFHSDKTLMFHIDWLDSTGNSIFQKRIDLAKNDTTSVLTSTIGISPSKRKTGEYFFRVYLFRELIAEKRFKLVDKILDPLIALRKEMTDNINLTISLGKKISKKTGKLVGADSVFAIRKKAKVYALIELSNTKSYLNQKKIFYLDWIGSDGNSFYKKKFEIDTGDSTSQLTSSISISSKKREPGIYKLKVYLFKKLIAEKIFKLN